jgi:hypothetical protein
VTRGHELEFLLDRAEDGRAATAPGPHFGGDVMPFGHRAGILEEMLIGEVSDANRVLPGQPVVGREHRHARFGQQRLDLQAALVGGQANVADVSPAVMQDSGLVVPVGAQHVHGQLRVTAGQRADGLGHDEARHETDREGAWAAAARLTRRRSASALASSGPASASSCRPAGVSSVARLSRTNRRRRSSAACGGRRQPWTPPVFDTSKV